jgi:hypothetical protein
MSTPVTPNFVSSQYWYAVLAWLEKQGTPYDEKEGHRLQLSYNSANQMPNEEPMKHIARFKFSEWEHPAPQPSPEDLLQLTVQEVVNQRIIAAKFSRGRSEKYLHRLILQVANTVMPFDWNEEKDRAILSAGAYVVAYAITFRGPDGVGVVGKLGGGGTYATDGTQSFSSFLSGIYPATFREFEYHYNPRGGEGQNDGASFCAIKLS